MSERAQLPEPYPWEAHRGFKPEESADHDLQRINYDESPIENRASEITYEARPQNDNIKIKPKQSNINPRTGEPVSFPGSWGKPTLEQSASQSNYPEDLQHRGAA